MRQVLILCTGNSCRSIMAEAMINHYLGQSWKAYSAGVMPSVVNPRAMDALREIGIDTGGFRSKSVTEFLDRDDLDLVITVCDHAKETCPVFLKPIPQIHLGIEDPAPYTDAPDEIAKAQFRLCREEILSRIIPYLAGYSSK